MQAQMLHDDSIQDLGDGLRETVAVANERPDLRMIEWSADIIKEMSRAALKVASLIDAYPSQLKYWPWYISVIINLSVNSFSGRMMSALSSDIANSIQQCQKRTNNLMTKFSLRLPVDTNKRVKQMKESADSKGVYSSG